MDNTLYVGLSHQLAMQQQLDIIANNIANASTTGYRAQSPLFQDYVVDTDTASTDGADRTITFVENLGLVRNLAQGEFARTDNSLDVAINGSGFFQVQDPDGNIFYTRNGHFHINDQGQIATTNGNLVLDSFGKSISVNPTDNEITIAGDGTITTASGRIGRLGVVSFADEQNMENVGTSMFTTDQTPAPADKAKLVSGMLESSNVEPILELTKMINVLRSYQSTAQLLQTTQDLQTQAIHLITQVQ